MREQHLSVVKSLAVAALLAFGAVASCSSEPIAQPDAGAEAAAPVEASSPCAPNQPNQCNGQCTSLRHDHDNCGKCGTACKAEEVCVEGTCQFECGPGTLKCGKACVSAKTDANNCGDCGHACEAGKVCSLGQCRVACQEGLTKCGSSCYDLQSDEDACGDCGVSCTSGQLCSAGKCDANCQGTWTKCGSQCADLQHDSQNCSACGNVCPTGFSCVPGAGEGGAAGCTLQCLGGSTYCGGKCVDVNIDPSNCGGCGNSCSGNCSAGNCCATGEFYCLGQCRTLTACIAVAGQRVTAGDYHSCAINQKNELKCWGYNTYGQLGDGTTTNKKTAGNALSLSNVSWLGSGSYGTTAVAGGSAYAWGAFNNYGMLGDGTTGTNKTSPIAATGITTATRSDNGYYHQCVLLSDNSVKCVGYNGYGQLGNNTTTNNTSFVTVGTGIDGGAAISASNVSVGQYHSCAVLTGTGAVKCWGNNGNGQLGDNTTTQRSTPVSVGTLTNVVSVSAGQYHTCAVTSSGSAYCWGYNGYGQLGDGTQTQRNTPTAVSGITNAVAIAANYYHTCAVLNNGQVKCWGYGYYGNLGDGTTMSSTYQTTPIFALIDDVISISTGYLHTCAMVASGDVKCWGYNYYGQVGDGTTTQYVGTPTLVLDF